MPTAPGHTPRSALLTTWGNAWLAADAALDEVVRRVTGPDEEHQVLGLGAGDLPLAGALGRLRAAGVTRLRLVLPVPGDVSGLPGPGPFTTAALAATEGVLAVGPPATSWGLVPTATAHSSPFDGTVTLVSWTAVPAPAPAADPGPFVADAEHDLRVRVMECADALAERDVASWRPELADELDQLRREARGAAAVQDLPGELPGRALRLLVQARSLATVLRLALADEGATVTGHQSQVRAAALRELARAVRAAQVAAYNSYGLPS